MSHESLPSHLEKKQRSALLRVLRATTKLPAQITFYAAALGTIILMQGVALPDPLRILASGVGASVLANILDRVAGGENISDEEIRRSVEIAVKKSGITKTLNTKETQIMIARLFRRVDLLRFAVQSSEYDVLKQLTEQARQHKSLVAKLRTDIAIIYTEMRKMTIQSTQTSEMLDYLSGLLSAIGFENPYPFLAPPRPPYRLVGRDSLLQDLKQQLISGNSLALSALKGLPGVGKTALAIELANDLEVIDRFQDGILWARLGYEADIHSELGKWATALHLPSQDVAKLTTVESFTEAIHAAIGTRRMLLIADDVWQTEVALSFRLGGPNCAHLITTRLPEVARNFADQGVITVQELSVTDGLRLLAKRAPKVVKAEPKEARTLVKAVGGLPLALTIIGGYLQKTTGDGQLRRLYTALDQLKQTKERLQLAQTQSPLERHPSLSSGTPLSLLAAIEISDKALDIMSRRTLLALSLFPSKPNSFSEEAALAVSNSPVETLDNLVDYGLLESSGPDRYTLHQTIADYAKMKQLDESTPERMVEFFVHYADNYKTDYDLLEPETANILNTLQIAFERGMQTALVKGTIAFYHFLEIRGLYKLAHIHLNKARQAAKSINDNVSLTTLLLNLGRVAERQGNYIEAEAVYKQGLSIAEKTAQNERASFLLSGLGVVELRRGNHKQAEKYLKQGLDLARKSDHSGRVSQILKNLGVVELRLGNYSQAEKYLQEGIDLARKLENPNRISASLEVLGAVATNRGSYIQAEEYLLEGIDIARNLGHQDRTCLLSTRLGILELKRGNYKQAEKYLQEGIDLARKIKHSERISLLLANLGDLEVRRGNYPQAEKYLQEGIDLARKIGHRENICFLLTNLSELKFNLNDYKQAEKYLREGMDLAQDMEYRWFISNSLNKLGELYLKNQKLNWAYTACKQALKIAHQRDMQEQIAINRYTLAKIAEAQNKPVEARHQGQESLKILETIGHYKIMEVKEWLTLLSSRNSNSEKGASDDKNA